MEKFTTLSGAAAPLTRANIDTDTIIRIERLTGIRREEMGAYAFEALRGEPDFVLSRPEFQDAPILIAGANFGCGSSREGAVWALMGMGLRCVIAESFGDIFFNNCFQNGMLPIALPADDIRRLAEQCAGGNARVTVDLKRQVVVSPRSEEIPFTIDAMRREALLEGLDDIGLTLKHEAAIAAYHAQDSAARPWVWQPGA
jgi:3-isopropylmalate/(R)-2-methylmalate dehydratase small subunit